MSDITLSAGVRQNLLSLQNTAKLMATTQNRLATGKEVNSALDNPTNFFTSSSLNTRASDLNSLLDSMANAVQTLEAADNGLTAITNTLESMQSTLRQARQDKSFETTSYDVDLGSTPAGTETLSLSDGAIGSTAVDISLTEATGTTAGTNTFTYAASALAFGASDTSTFDIAVDGNTPATVTLDQATVQAVGNNDSTIDDIDELTDALNAALTTAGVTGVTATNDGTDVTFTSDTLGSSSSVVISSSTANADGAGAANTLYGIADGAGTAGTDTITAKSVDTLVAEINANASLDGLVEAANDDGKLRLENLSTTALTVTGVTASTGTIDGGSGTDSIDGNEVRTDLSTQYNDLRDQLDKLSDDSSYNGVNLLQGDLLTITFNETGTSTLDIQTENGETINSTYLGISSIAASDFDSDDNIDTLLNSVSGALDTIRSQASTFGSNLSMVENRQDFTGQMINTLETGADNLVLADSNEEGANMLALQTRQQLSTTALSLASQADQAVLSLF